MHSPADRSLQRGVTALGLVLAVVVVLIALVVSISALSAYRTSAARKGWDEVLGSWDEVMERYPLTEANASALELERLAGAVGLNIAPRYTERSDAIPKQHQAAFNKIKTSVFYSYLEEQTERTERGSIDPPSPELTAFMNEFDEELVAIRRHLNRGIAPVWESDMSLAENAPIPNLLGHIDLQKLLCSVALARLYAGDAAAAEADVRAAWHLSRGLRDSPILISQMILVAGARVQLGVLRHIPDLDEIWLDRLAEHDHRESFIRAMKYEGWVWVYHDDVWFANGEWPLWQRLAVPLTKPYAKLCMADVSEAWRERLVNLEKVDAICDRDLSQYDADMEIPLPRWNKLGEQITGNLGSAIHRLARLELDRELTRLLIEADADRRANGGEWPASLTAMRGCVTCPDDRWNYSVTDAGLEIALSRDVRWPNQKGTILPTRVMAR